MKITVALIWLSLIIASLIGWVINVVKLFGLWGADVTTEFIIRLVGVPIPFIGAIAGYF